MNVIHKQKYSIKILWGRLGGNYLKRLFREAIMKFILASPSLLRYTFSKLSLESEQLTAHWIVH